MNTWVLAVGTLLVAGGWVATGPPRPSHPGSDAHERSFGRVLDPSGAPAAGALVTGIRPDGRAVTVYSAADGTFLLPEDAGDAREWVAWLPGVGRVQAEGGGSPPPLRIEASDPVTAPGSAWLATLPEGPDTRRFILDCTGCHVTDEARVRTADGPRSAAGWEEAVRLMRANFGPGTGFPVISSWSRPERVGPWAAEHLSAATPRTPLVEGPAPRPGETGAVLTEYPIPEPGDLPHDLMVDSRGSVWITGMFTHRMYVLDPSTGRFGTVPIPVPNANPRALDIDGSGRIWVVLGAPGQVAIHDPVADSWESVDVGLYAHSVMVDAAGDGWVNGHFTVNPEVIASVDGETGAVARYTVPRDGPSAAEDGESTIPYGLRVGPDGIVWGTQLRGNRLVRLDPATGAVEQFPMPEEHAGPRRPDVGPDGSLWIPLYASNALVRFDPATRSFDRWDFPVDGALPYVVRVDRTRGTVWIGTGHGDVVASFDPEEESFTLYPLPTRGALIRHLDVDEARNEVWFAYGASPGIPGKILRLQPGEGR